MCEKKDAETTCDAADDGLAALRGSNAFAGMDPKDYARAIEDLRGTVTSYDAGESIRHTGDAVDGVFIVLKGRIRVGMLLEDREMNVERFGPGEAFGEAIAFSETTRHSPVEITSEAPSEVLYLGTRELKAASTLLSMRVYTNLMGEMSDKLVRLSTKIHILGKKLARDKVAAYLASQPGFEAGRVRVPLGRGAWAEYLATDRSSLNRALHALEDDGLIEVSEQDIHILDRARLLEQAYR